MTTTSPRTCVTKARANYQFFAALSPLCRLFPSLTPSFALSHFLLFLSFSPCSLFSPSSPFYPSFSRYWMCTRSFFQRTNKTGFVANFSERASVVSSQRHTSSSSPNLAELFSATESCGRARWLKLNTHIYMQLVLLVAVSCVRTWT